MIRPNHNIMTLLTLAAVVNLMHSPCICGSLFSEVSKHACTELVTPEPANSCCTVPEAEPKHSGESACNSGKCCSGWFQYVKPSELARQVLVPQSSDILSITISPSECYQTSIQYLTQKRNLFAVIASPPHGGLVLRI